MKKLFAKIRNWIRKILGKVAPEMSVPSWKECVHASCWDGSNAQRRMMNMLSPKFSDGKFKEYLDWMKGRGCDTAHVFLMNGGDGEGAGYTAVDNVGLTIKRLKQFRSAGFAVVPWIIADDSSAYAKKLFANPEQFIAAFDAAEIFKYASMVVLGLEMDEYGNAAQWNSVRKAIKNHCPKMKLGVHHTSGKYTFANLGDVVFDQLDPKAATKSAITASIKKIRSMGKEAVGFEYARQADRKKAQWALDAGAFGVGNW